jgi:hypothetical protein
MIAPSPRGFPRSHTEAICEHVSMAHKPQRRPLSARWKAEAEKGGDDVTCFDLCALFDLPPLRDAAHSVRSRTITPFAARADVSTTEREFWIGFNPPQFHVKKDGEITEKKMKVTLIAKLVTIQSGNVAPVAMFRATNRGVTIIKHPVCITDGAGKETWTGPRFPLCEVNRELVRLLGATEAAPISAQLAALQPKPKAKVRTPRPMPVNAQGRTPAEGRTPEWEAKRHRQPDAEAAPLTDKQIESLSDEEFAARMAGTFAAMDVITRAGTPDFYTPGN